MLDYASSPAYTDSSIAAWAGSYTRRPRRAATIAVENQVWSPPCDNIWSYPLQSHNQSSSSEHQQQSAMTRNAAASRPHPMPQENQRRHPTLEHDLEYHPQQSVYDRRQQKQAQYQAYRPNFQNVNYQRQPSHQQQQPEQSVPWPTTPPPAALESATDLAARSYSLCRNAITGVEGLGPLIMEGSESGRARPAVAMVVVMDRPGNRELQGYSGSTLDGYNSSGYVSSLSTLPPRPPSWSDILAWDTAPLIGMD